MFSKKYIFDIRRKKRRSKLFIAFNFLFLSFIFINITLLIYIYQFADDETLKSNNQFMGQSPDLICVFTGDQGRIEYAISKIHEHPESKLFISGVFEKNSLNTIINNINEKLHNTSHLKTNTEIDYFARNTIENVLSTLRHIENQENIKNILIISSSYHLFRINYILSKLNKKEELSFYYSAVKKKEWSVRNIKIVIKEVLKFYKALFVLKFWDI